MMRLAFLSAVAAVSMIGCANHDSDSAVSSSSGSGKFPSTIATTSATLDSIGVIHNQALNAAYAAIVLNRIPVHTSTPSRSIIADSVHSVVNGYFAGMGLTSSGVVNTYNTYAPRPSGSLVDFTDTCTALTSGAKAIIDKLDEAIVQYDAGTINIMVFVSKCDSLQNACLTVLSGNQTLFAGAAVATAKASAQYWDANTAAWDNEIVPATATMKKSDKAILRSDAQSAVGGAITGVFGGPVGIAAGAWFGGCVGSIIEGICIGFGW